MTGSKNASRDEFTADSGANYNVIAVSFADDSNAYRALTALKELDSQERVGVQEAVVVVREADGQLVEKDRIETSFLPGTVSGGLIGLLLGVLGGPIGVLIGGTGGVLVGSLFDLEDLDDTESALSAISATVAVGRTGLLAVVSERSPEVVDSAMSELGGTVVRRTVSDVEAEIAAAEKAERKAKREARKELVRERQSQSKANVDAKIAELKGKLHRKDKDQAAGAGVGS
jgi:uncharacterized membrane protein